MRYCRIDKQLLELVNVHALRHKLRISLTNIGLSARVSVDSKEGSKASDDVVCRPILTFSWRSSSRTVPYPPTSADLDHLFSFDGRGRRADIVAVLGVVVIQSLIERN